MRQYFRRSHHLTRGYPADGAMRSVGAIFGSAFASRCSFIVACYFLQAFDGLVFGYVVVGR